MKTSSSIPITEQQLSFIWQHGLFASENLKTVTHQSVQINKRGTLNTDSGPDFSIAQIQIDDKVWVGNVELHIRTSEWNKHGHQHDEAYENVILHVVYENDLHIPANDIPVLELKNHIFPSVLLNLTKLGENLKALPCAGIYQSIDAHLYTTFIQGYLLDRISEKAKRIEDLLRENRGDIQAACYAWILIGFGGHLNKTGFELLAKQLPLSTLLKNCIKPQAIVALLFGVAGFLEDESRVIPTDGLKAEYDFLKEKYKLESVPTSVWKFSRVRPPGFATERLLQFAVLVINNFELLLQTPNVLHVVMQSDVAQKQPAELAKHFQKGVKGYGFSQSFLSYFDVNVLEPLRLFLAQQGNGEWDMDASYERLSKYKPEDNKITRQFMHVGFGNCSMAESQALHFLYQKKCRHLQCLHCKFGYQFLKAT